MRAKTTSDLETVAFPEAITRDLDGVKKHAQQMTYAGNWYQNQKVISSGNFGYAEEASLFLALIIVKL